MIKAKNLIRSAFPAVLTLLLCCVASAGPTYSFVKIAGEWAFYEENEGLISGLEATPSNQDQLKKANRPLLVDEGSNLGLPAVGSIATLSSEEDSDSKYLALLPSGNTSRAPRAASVKRDALNDKSMSSKGLAIGSSFAQPPVANGFQNSSGTFGSSFRNGNSSGPNGNAWGYWKKGQEPDTQDPDIAPVPVPVPGSIILAVVGAGLVKLLHDRRARMSAAV